MVTDAQHFTYMQATVDAVSTSTHPVNKIAATLILKDSSTITSPNIWLTALAPHGSNEKIGGASPTIHAEVATLIDAIKQGKSTKGASLYLTDPPCPNCIKLLIAAGITNIYVDIKGFRKDWYRRRRNDFKALSLKMAEQSGVTIHIVERFKNHASARTRPINCPAPTIHNIQQKSTPFITVQTKEHTHLTIYQSQIAQTSIPESSKYNTVIQPINCMIATCAKDGLTPTPPITTSHTPTAREFVNLYGLTQHLWEDGTIHITIQDKTIDPANPQHIKGDKALKTLQNYGLIKEI